MKTNIYYSLLFLLLIVISSCNTKQDKNQLITNTVDYNEFLKYQAKNTLSDTEKELIFWEDKYAKAPNQFSYLGKIANAYTKKFMISGDIDALKKAEDNLLTLNKNSNFTKASHLRSLARNYISQHKFKEALVALLKAKNNGENLQATHKMLFDVYLELGNVDKAVSSLNEFKNFSDFDYLIRLSKYSDHQGDLDSAIRYLEKALVIAEASNIDDTKQWTYTNLADYYGHAGRIKDSYNYYLKALQLDKSNAYAKKGIAWIVYSYERNPDEALRILNSITTYNQSPDYYLLKSEIADFMNDKVKKENNLMAFNEAVSNTNYGDMYNTYKIELYSDQKVSTEKAIELAIKEVENRPTAEAYDLLAWSYLKNGDAKKALDIMEKHVVNKTSEPSAMYHLAEVYKANEKEEKAQKLKLELLDSAFELGPVSEMDIRKL